MPDEPHTSPGAVERCASVHWSLPVQCALDASHADNWHETWHPETGNRIRYRYSVRLTQELRDGSWVALDHLGRRPHERGPGAGARDVAETMLRRAIDGIQYDDIANYLYETGEVKPGRQNAVADEALTLIGEAEVRLPTLITTAEQLRALRVGTVLLGPQVRELPRRVWQVVVNPYNRKFRMLISPGSDYAQGVIIDVPDSEATVLADGPLRVLHTPADAGEAVSETPTAAPALTDELIRNTILAWQVMGHLETHPDEWIQDHWHLTTPCGTAACFAGWTLLLSGAAMSGSSVTIKSLPERAAANSEVMRDADLRWDGTAHVSTAARVLLGLDRRSADCLFHSDNTLEDLRRLVEEYFGPRPTGSPASATTEQPSEGESDV